MLKFETSEELRDQSLARTYQYNAEFERHLATLKNNPEEFAKLPPSVKIAVGHYKDAREAFRKIEDQKKEER